MHLHQKFERNIRLQKHARGKANNRADAWKTRKVGYILASTQNSTKSNQKKKAPLMTSEEPLLRLLLVHSNLDMHMIRHHTRFRARRNALQPLISVILVLGIMVIVINTISARRSTDPRMTTTIRLASAEQTTRFAFTLEQVRKRAPTRGLDEQHATKSWARLARQQTEDGFSASIIERRHAITALTPFGRR
jgi:hypothetical protein